VFLGRQFHQSLGHLTENDPHLFFQDCCCHL
jgi:hypothetical protein